jgi:hypothetical protein
MDTELGEGDNIRTDPGSRVQVMFGDHVGFVLNPGSEVHITHMNALGEDEMLVDDETYEFRLLSGMIAFSVDLPTANSQFTLGTPNGAAVITTGTDHMLFSMEADGSLLVFEGTVPYFPPPTRADGAEGQENISAGEDGSGDHFDRAVIRYENEVAAGIVRTIDDGSIGFDNSMDFVGSGDIDGFVFRFAEMDQFYIFGTDMRTLELDITRVGSGRFDLYYSQYTPDEEDEVHLRGFVFDDMSTPTTGTIDFEFKVDQVTLTSESRLTYDFEIRYKETQRFYLNGMYTEAGHRNIFYVLNYIFIQNEDVNAVQFGLDRDNDGTYEDDILIHTGMTGDQVYDDLDDDDDGSGLIVLLIAIVIILLVAGAYFVIQTGPGGFGFGTEEEEEISDDGPIIEDGADLIPPMREPESDLTEESITDERDEERPSADEGELREFPEPPMMPAADMDEESDLVDTGEDESGSEEPEEGTEDIDEGPGPGLDEGSDEEDEPGDDLSEYLPDHPKPSLAKGMRIWLPTGVSRTRSTGLMRRVKDPSRIPPRTSRRRSPRTKRRHSGMTRKDTSISISICSLRRRNPWSHRPWTPRARPGRATRARGKRTRSNGRDRSPGRRSSTTCRRSVTRRMRWIPSSPEGRMPTGGTIGTHR